MPEIYVSTDVETDGPIPGPHSMLSFGSAAYTADKQLIRTFTANLHTLPDASGHPATMAWWLSQPDAWAEHRRDLREPGEAMKAYVAWVKKLPGKPVFVAYPAGFDFLFMYWYMIRFAGESPFSFSAVDIKSFAEKLAYGLSATVLRRPWLYRIALRCARLVLRPLARDGWLRSLPGPGAAWTVARDFPAPAARSFRELWPKL